MVQAAEIKWLKQTTTQTNPEISFTRMRARRYALSLNPSLARLHSLSLSRSVCVSVCVSVSVSVSRST